MTAPIALALSAGGTVIALLIGAVIFVIVVAVCAVLLALLNVVLPEPAAPPEDEGVASGATAGGEPTEPG